MGSRIWYSEEDMSRETASKVPERQERDRADLWREALTNLEKASPEAKQDSVIQEVVKENVYARLYVIWGAPAAQELGQAYGIPKEALVPEALRCAKKMLQEGRIYGVFPLRDAFGFSNVFLAPFAEEGVRAALKDGAIQFADRIRQEFSVSEEVYMMAGQEAVRSAMKKGDWENAQVLQARFRIPEAEFAALAEEGACAAMRAGRVSDAEAMSEVYSIPYRALRQEAKTGAQQSIRVGALRGAIRIRDDYEVPEDALKQAASEGAVTLLRSLQFERAKEFREYFSFTEAEFHAAVIEAIKRELREGWITSASKLRERYSVRDEELTALASAEMERLLLEEEDPLGAFHFGVLSGQSAEQLESEGAYAIQQLLSSQKVAEALRTIRLFFGGDRARISGEFIEADEDHRINNAFTRALQGRDFTLALDILLTCVDPDPGTREALGSFDFTLLPLAEGLLQEKRVVDLIPLFLRFKADPWFREYVWGTLMEVPAYRATVAEFQKDFSLWSEVFN